MNIRTIATATAAALIGVALPAAALSVDVGTKASGNAQSSSGYTPGSATVGLTGDVNLSDKKNSGATSSEGSGQSKTETSMDVSSDTTAAVKGILVTRADIDSGSVTATSANAGTVSGDTDLKGYIAAQMKSDANIGQVETSADNVSVTYKDHARLLGFIPVTVDATTVVDGNGDVTVSYPWYQFLMATNKANLESKIQSRIDSSLNVSGSASANTNASANAAAKLSAATQARIVAEVQAAMQQEFNASADASMSASGAANVQ